MSRTLDNMSQERLNYLASVAVEKLQEGIPGDAFIDLGEGRIAWIAPEDAEVLLITIQRGRLQVQAG